MRTALPRLLVPTLLCLPLVACEPERKKPPEVPRPSMQMPAGATGSPASPP